MPNAKRFPKNPPGGRDVVRFVDGWKFHHGDLPFKRSFRSLTKWQWKPAGLHRPEDESTSALETLASETKGWRETGPDVDVYGLKAKWTGTEPAPHLLDHKTGFVWFRSFLPVMPSPPTIHFTCVRENADVFLNGRRLCSHARWIHPFDVDLGEAWRKGGPNTLLLLVEGDPWGCWVGSCESELPAEAADGPASLVFDDRDWSTVSVPHDFVVKGAFDPNADVSHGFLPRDVAWYRRSFDIPESDRGRRFRLDFDGVFRDARVWLNGCWLGRHRGGYTPFGFDITHAVRFGGVNQLSVRVDARGAEGWWYEGGGLYRHVRLTKTHPLSVAPFGVHVSAAPKGRTAALTIETRVENLFPQATSFQIQSEVFDPNGKRVLKLPLRVRLRSGAQKTFVQKNALKRPKLWDGENPNLYRLVTVVQSGKRVVDRVETTFGVRSIRFHPDRGFLLNGKAVKIQGTCNHQDHAGVGVALTDRLFAYRIEKLRAMGCNAYRCAHHPHAPELLDACDRLGMLVLDENRRLGDTEEFLSQAEAMVLRDRNHPCVIGWSICNEEPRQGTPEGRRAGLALKRVVLRHDRTRPILAALNGGFERGLIDILDVAGFNYNLLQYDLVRNKRPGLPLLASETASTVSTRGEYENKPQKGYVSAYDENHPEWAHTAEAAWRPVAERPHMAGAFVWTGFDYRGEPTPYGWPCVNSHFGVLDTCGFPKDNFWYYKAWWSKEPVLHLLPHWNWKGREGREIDVMCHTNYDQVELFLNGKLLGSREVPRWGALRFKTRYAPGVLSAKGYRKGVLSGETKVETTGEPFSLRLEPYGSKMTADAADIMPVEVSVLDASGRVVPTASHLIRFTVKGPGDIAGVGNGDPSSHEPDHASQRKCFHGLCACFVRSRATPGGIRLRAEAEGLLPATLNLTAQ